MKVSCAAPEFSHSVASVISLLARSGIQGPGGITLDSEALGTAKILKFFDNLFDSVNSSSLYPKGGKTLRCCISTHSSYIEFWNTARTELKIIKERMKKIFGHL